MSARLVRKTVTIEVDFAVDFNLDTEHFLGLITVIDDKGREHEGYVVSIEEVGK